jgi:hypothetical protein
MKQLFVADNDIFELVKPKTNKLNYFATESLSLDFFHYKKHFLKNFIFETTN